MRIVLDTNIVISALLWRGAPYQLLHTISQHTDIQLYSSAVLLEEFTDVLMRTAVTKRLAVIDQTAGQVLSDYLDIINLSELIEISPVARDPDDDHVLACAYAAQADLIVTGDADLLALQEYQKIRIVDAATAITLIKEIG